MSRIDYETFEIAITTRGKTFLVAARGHRNETNPVSVEFSEDEIALNKGPQSRANNSNGTRHLIIDSNGTRKDYPILWTMPPTAADARDFGGRLFKAVFKDGVRDLFVQCKGKAEGNRANLRIQFDLTGSPKLAVWPWEFLHNPDRDQFFAMFPDSPIVRYLRLPYSEVPLEVKPPLRILVMVSMPNDLPKLDAARELSGIKNALTELSDQKLLAIELLKEASLSALYTKLEEATRNGTPFHIFHYIGHGVFDTDENQGNLLFVRNDGKGEAINGQRIGTCLRSFKHHLRLVLLNSCEGARLSRIDSYAGVAQKILQVGEIPAALAMQFSITDQAAVTFAELFYQGLAHNYPLEEDLARARLQMQMLNVKEEWATPVLYMRGSDGYIMQVQPPQQRRVPTVGAAPTLGNLTRHYGEIEKELDKGKLVIFLGLNVNLYGRQLSDDWMPGAVLPGNLELSDYLRRRHHYPLSGVPLARLAQHLVVNRGKSDLYDAFANTFNDQVELPQLYPFLGQIVKRTQQRLPRHPDPVRRRPIILTTNYDNSLERGFDHEGINMYHVISYSLENEQQGEFQHMRVERGQKISDTVIGERNREAVLEDDNPVIIKLPGAVESDQPNYVVTEDHFFYLARRNLLKMLPKKIVSALTTARHLYLGYNIQDWPFRTLLYSIWGDRKPKCDSWAVIPNAEDPNKSYWKDCGVEVVEATLENYVIGLQHHLFRSKGGEDEPSE